MLRIRLRRGFVLCLLGRYCIGISSRRMLWSIRISRLGLLILGAVSRISRVGAMRRNFRLLSRDVNLFVFLVISTPSYQIYWKDAIVKMPGLLHKYQNNRKRFDEHPLFDVYSFGRTLSFIFFGKLAPPVPESQNFAPPYGHFYQNLIFLIEMCLQIDPDDRPSFGEITTFLGVLGKLLEINNK